jgi:glutathione S-transferase
MRYHSEKIPSAIERYQKEMLRVIGVLESVLSKQPWLVGDKMTVADLSFIPYVVHIVPIDSSKTQNTNDGHPLYGYLATTTSRQVSG